MATIIGQYNALDGRHDARAGGGAVAMRGPADVLVPFERDDVTAAWCHDRRYDVPWSEAWEQADFAQMYSYHDIRADFEGDLPMPYDGAWIAKRERGAWWYRASAGAMWAGQPLDLYAAGELVEWALALRGAERIEWIGRDNVGWPMPRGYYGLIAPARECALVAGDMLRWVVQTETPHGDYALVFDSLRAGRDGEPHPTGLWRLAEGV